MKKILLCCFIVLTALSTAGAEPSFTINAVLSEAQPDECFAGLGVNYPNGIAGYYQNAGPPCPETVLVSGVTTSVKEKYNQTYVWGMTRYGNSLWFGTGANVYCTTANMYIGYEDPDESSRVVCEYGDSQLVRDGIIYSGGRGDFRPPTIFEYVLDAGGTSGTLIDRTPNDPLIRQVMGIRSAGSHNGVVFMAGGARIGGGIIMFAFDADTKQYLGSQRITQYGSSNSMSIRKWLVVNNRLYTGVGAEGTTGYVLRWTGSKSNPFSFLVVGRIFGLPREFAQYTDANGRARLAVTSQGLWLSPPIYYARGLLNSQAGNWTQIWTPWSYDPDMATAIGYGGGPVHQFDGWLYWATTQVPTRGAYLHENCPYWFVPCYGPPQNSAEENELFNGTWRATTLWRGRNLESANPEIQLLYGESELPMYSAGTRSFETVSTGWTPLYGHSGYEDPTEGINPNMYNSYTWTMDVAAGKLFLGTYDVGGGADLWRIDNSATPAKREDGNGAGDRNNYGIRTMEVSADGNTLYLGMATNVNLPGSPSSTRFEPGWELRAMQFGINAVSTIAADPPVIEMLDVGPPDPEVSQ